MYILKFLLISMNPFHNFFATEPIKLYWPALTLIKRIAAFGTSN